MEPNRDSSFLANNDPSQNYPPIIFSNQGYHPHSPARNHPNQRPSPPQHQLYLPPNYTGYYPNASEQVLRPPPPLVGQDYANLPGSIDYNHRDYLKILQYINLSCPTCSAKGTDQIQMTHGCATICWSVALFYLTGIVCCWLPFVIDNCKDIRIICRRCDIPKHLLRKIAVESISNITIFIPIGLIYICIYIFIIDNKLEMSEQEIDPSIYQYDEVYEEIKAPKKTKPIQKQKQKPNEGNQQRKGSKYIGKMKALVQKRQKDHKRAYEKKQQRMNEKLGIGEEEVFVTESYLKKKMQQEKIKKQEQEQQQYDKKHSVQDKQKGRQKMNEFRNKLLDSR